VERKTFERISKVKNLVPFANCEFITINGKKCKNIFLSVGVSKILVTSFLGRGVYLKKSMIGVSV
jgi:hypothetical protein